MIPKSKKKTYTDLPEGLSSQLQTAFTSPDPQSDSKTQQQKTAGHSSGQTLTSGKSLQEDTSASAEDRNPKNRNGQINICVPSSTKLDWKILFARNSVSITQGIIFAVEHLKDEIERGEAVLTVGGVIRKG